MHQLLSSVELAKVNVRVGPNSNRILPRLARQHKCQRVWPGFPTQHLFRITRLAATHSWCKPDLEKVDWRVWRRIKFAVPDTTPGAHVLQIACLDDAPITHRVLVFQFTLDHVAENFGVSMGVLAESPARLDHIIINDAQGSKAHVIGIKVISKGKGVPAMQPSKLSLTARSRRTLYNGRFNFRCLIQYCRFHAAISRCD